MAFFNFRNKSNNGVSEETTKAYWEWEKNERLNLPTTEEAIKAIVGQTTPSQLKKLEVVGKDGTVVTFEDKLLLKYEGLYPKLKTKEIIAITKDTINKHKYLFDLQDWRVIYVFFKDVCDEFFSKNI